jgi:hypothetical protein
VLSEEQAVAKNYSGQLLTTTATLTVAENSGPTPIGIAAPSDSNYAASQLTITVMGLPTDGTVLLADGIAVTVGETLTVAQLTGLLFIPTAGATNECSGFTYSVTDPSGQTVTGSASLAIAAPDGATLLAGTGGSLITAAGTWSFGGRNGGGYKVLLNGQWVGNGSGTELEVANQGNLYVLGSNQSWYEWLDGSWTAISGSPPLSGSLAVDPTSLTVAENSAPTPIGIAAPTDPNYSASQLSVKITGLPTDGTVLLSDGTTAVTAGEILTVAQLTGLEFQPNAGAFGESSTLTYSVTDPSGLSAKGSATLAIGPDTTAPTTTAASLTVAENSAPTPIGIAAPTDPNYSASQLTVEVASLPSDGTVLLSDGVTPVSVGQTLSVAALTTLLFAPTPNLASTSSNFLYTVTDPSGLSTKGSATVAIAATSGGISPDGSTLLAGSAGSLVTSAGTWTFGTTTTSYGYDILLNGAQAAGGSAVELEVANQGNLYADNSLGTWYEWANSSWVQTTNPDPTSTTTTSATSTSTTLSPDGSTLMAGSGGSLVTSAGTWTFGTTSTSYGYAILLNGAQAAGGSAVDLEVASQGNLYADNSSGTWYEWVNSGWVQTTNPNTTTTTTTTTSTTSSGAIDTAPALPQPSQSGDIVGVRLQNAGAATEASGYVTFGEVFADGAVSPTDTLVARINGVNYAVQMDVKSTNTDGSVRQAILTLDVPSIPAGGTLDLMLSKGTAAAPSPAAPSASALLASGYNLAVNFTFTNPDGTTTTDSASAAAALQAALNAGTVSDWLSGPEVNEYDVHTTVDSGKLNVEFDIRAYANGTITTDEIFSTASTTFVDASTTAAPNLNYSVSISQGGQQVYSATGISQYMYSMWDHQVASAGTISPNVQYDVPYLMATGALPAYDTSYGVSDAAIQTNYNALNATNTGPLGTGTVDTYMPGTGGRQDIGPQPNWTAQWLLSQNADAYQVMMADANVSGGVPWHYIDASTGEPVNAQTYPMFTIQENFPQYGFIQPSNGWPTYGANGDPWTPDAAHMPDLNYIPYLVTGSHYQLELLQAQADFAITSVLNSGTALDTSGTVPLGFADSFSGNGNIYSSNGNQLRAVAWELREVAEAAYITPDDDSMKSYFTNELDIAMKGLVQEYVVDNINGIYGQLNGFLQGSSGPNTGTITPYEEDEMVTALGAVAGMGIPQASAEAVQMLAYMNNFVSGVFTHGSSGFNPLDGTAYWISVNDPTSTAPYTSWSQFFNANVNSTWQQGNVGIPATPTELINWPTETGGGYGPVAKAALADEITYTGSPQAIQAYGFVVSQIAYAFSLGGSTFSVQGGPTESAAYQYYPEWSIVPRLPDGVYLQNSQMQIDTSNAAAVNLTATGGDALLAVVGSGTATLTSDSAAGGSALLYGGSGPTTLIAAGGNDYLFGGGSGSSYVYDSSGASQFGPQQSTTFVDGTGNDYMYGGTGANIYEFKQSNTAGARSTTIANFNINSDELRIAANIDGNGITSASQLLSSATVSNSSTVLHLSPNDDITLLGINQPSSLLNHIIVS